ncbi:MAG: hypothetical protein WB697_18095 [Stellaceae bacterium]
MRGSKVIALAVVITGALAGCSWSENMAAKIAPDTVSLADRCGAIMKAAMPFAQLEIGDRGSRSPDVRTIIAQVAATRTDLPKDAAAGRDLVAECTFENNVMTAFRWTKGGPPPPPASDQTQPASKAPPASSPSASPPPASPSAPAGKSQPAR